VRHGDTGASDFGGSAPVLFGQRLVRRRFWHTARRWIIHAGEMGCYESRVMKNCHTEPIEVGGGAPESGVNNYVESYGCHVAPRPYFVEAREGKRGLPVDQPVGRQKPTVNPPDAEPATVKPSSSTMIGSITPKRSNERASRSIEAAECLRAFFELGFSDPRSTISMWGWFRRSIGCSLAVRSHPVIAFQPPR
jgi:hypothetical protein